MSTAIKTPRTDAAAKWIGEFTFVNALICADIERELAAAKAELAVAERALAEISQIDFRMAATNGCAFTAVKTAMDAFSKLAEIRKVTP